MKLSVPGLITAVLLLLATSAAVLFFNAKNRDTKPRQTSFPIMGTICCISVYGNESQLNTALAAGKAEFERVNAACSLYNTQSELYRLNATAAEREFICSEAMWFLIKRARQAYIESSGNFDITVKPLMDLWGFYRKHGEQAPSEEEINAVLKKVGFDKLILNDSKRSIKFSVPGMALDMGGIAKGYAADLAMAAIARCGISSGVVDIGGNLRFLPAPPPGRKHYRVAIRDPHDPGKTLPQTLEVKPGMAVATSGDYERFVIFNGKRYGHIISPKTGIPGQNIAVTVITDTALDADVFSTSCAIGNRNIAAKLQRLHPELQVIFAD